MSVDQLVDDELVGRPCRYCVANWAMPTAKNLPKDWKPQVPDPQDCLAAHDRNDEDVVALAAALAEVFQQAGSTDAQIAYFLGDACDVLETLDSIPERWEVERLPDNPRHDDEIDAWMRINGVEWVSLAGGKDSRGQMVTLAEWSSWNDDEDEEEDDDDE